MFLIGCIVLDSWSLSLASSGCLEIIVISPFHDGFPLSGSIPWSKGSMIGATTEGETSGGICLIVIFHQRGVGRSSRSRSTSFKSSSLLQHPDDYSQYRVMLSGGATSFSVRSQIPERMRRLIEASGRCCRCGG